MREESEASGSTEAVTQARQPDAGKTAEQSAVDCTERNYELDDMNLMLDELAFEIGLTGEVQPQPGKGGSGGQDTLEPAANRQKLSHGTTEARATGESAASIVDSRGATTCIPPNDLGIDWKGHVEVNLDKRISPKPQDDEQRPAPHSLPLATEASGKPRNMGHEDDQGEQQADDTRACRKRIANWVHPLQKETERNKMGRLGDGPSSSGEPAITRMPWKSHDKKPQDDEQRPAPHSLPLATEASGKPRNLGHEADQWRARTGMARTLPAPVSPAGASQSALGDRGTRRPRAPSLPIPVDDKGPHWSPRAPHGVPAGPCGPHGVPVGYHRSPWAPHGSPWVPMRSHVVLAGFP